MTESSDAVEPFLDYRNTLSSEGSSDPSTLSTCTSTDSLETDSSCSGKVVDKDLPTFEDRQVQMQRRKIRQKLYVILRKTIIVSIIVMVIGFLSVVSMVVSGWDGYTRLVTKKGKFVKYFANMAKEQIYQIGMFTLTSAQESEVIKCLESGENGTSTPEWVNVNTIQALRVKHLHHFRLITNDGVEKSRVDFSHNGTFWLSSVTYDKSNSSYHKHYQEKLAVASTQEYPLLYVMPWSTHYISTMTVFRGNDFDGDHHIEHLEDERESIPSLIKMYVPVRDNDENWIGYVISNLRMNEVLKTVVDMQLFPGKLLIVDESGDIVFNSHYPKKLFESLWSDESSFSNILSFTSQTLSDRVAYRGNATSPFSVHISMAFFLTCLRIQLDGDRVISYGKYYVCVESNAFEILTESVLFFGFFVVLVAATISLIVCGFVLAGKNSKLKVEKDRYSSFIHQIYPEFLIESTLQEKIRGSVFHDEYALCFIDIVGFSSLTNQLEPAELLEFLQNTFEAFDAAARLYRIIKVKYVGDCVFSIAKSDEYDSNEDDVTKRMVKYGMFVANFAKNHGVDFQKLPFYDLQVRVGINVGSVVSGILSPKMPLFDVWGSDVNLAARLEQRGKKNRLHVSAKVREIIHKNPKFEKQFSIRERISSLKGFGRIKTYILRCRKRGRFEEIMKRLGGVLNRNKYFHRIGKDDPKRIKVSMSTSTGNLDSSDDDEEFFLPSNKLYDISTD